MPTRGGSDARRRHSAQGPRRARQLQLLRRAAAASGARSGFAARDCEPGADLVVVLSHDLWRTAFAADPGIVGRTVQLNRQRSRSPVWRAEGTFNGSSFLGGGYLAPINAGRLLASDDSRYDDDTSLWLNLLGRRKDGVALQQVRAELDVIAAQIDQQQPADRRC